ncbi:hypothetical protein NUW58_g4638 [Xylaria curta]|uniref:Uncharacterized protein n=1 Tax=Xylaria curta TaxID=42375 RepID=A0ACC1P7S7_9PEZI|nr:hypothetical protein NUW58_g4638 [Xylaria curta]
MSTNTPALMSSSAESGIAHVLDGNDVAPLSTTSGIEINAPASALASTNSRSGNITPASTLRRRATVMSAARSTVIGNREADAPSLEDGMSVVFRRDTVENIWRKGKGREQ